SDADLAALLELYRDVRKGRRVGVDDTNPLIDLLRVAGSARVESGRLRVRNRLYERVLGREWGRQRTPDRGLRRRRGALRRGLVRASTIAGAVLALVSALAVMAASQAARADRGEQLARLETARANAKSDEARRNATQAQDLAARLRTALNEKEKAFRDLER